MSTEYVRIGRKRTAAGPEDEPAAIEGEVNVTASNPGAIVRLLSRPIRAKVVQIACLGQRRFAIKPQMNKNLWLVFGLGINRVLVLATADGREDS